MEQDIEIARTFYAHYKDRLDLVRETLGTHLTLTEKIIFSHLYDSARGYHYRHGEDYVELRPDRVAMQDATAQMAVLQFMNAGRSRVAVPATIHCDHLIQAYQGSETDLPAAVRSNGEVYDFLCSAARKYGIGFWKPGAGIIHQIVLEHYAFPGGMMVGTDSHTPNAGGLSMMAVGVGGADAVDVLTAEPWQLKMPRIYGVHLTGRLSGWASPKDIILKLLGMLTVKGGTNAVIEYFGPGVATLSATGRATICNMGAELGATCSLFPYDEATDDYLRQTGRVETARMAHDVAGELQADAGARYDQVIELDLSEIHSYLNGPFTPDAATDLREMKDKRIREDWPQQVEVALVGSCTNSSYEDLSRAASVARQAKAKGLKPKAQLIVSPGSDLIRQTAERDGLLDDLRSIGAVIMANACGPCIGQWHRVTDDPEHKNTIVTTFNRNFRRRADGNPNTYAFIGSPAIVTALAIAGQLDFDPETDTITDEHGYKQKLDEPFGETFPPRGFSTVSEGFIAPVCDPSVQVVISPHSQRLQRLKPFQPWDGKDMYNLALLIKTQGKCTTDHISMAGPWLKYRGHLEHISDNLLMGAVNAFNGQTNHVLNLLTDQYDAVSAVAKAYKAQGLGSIVVAEDNYGEGSSREHAAMEPRYLNVKVILAKSFARIHETNLKKQGVLALTFADKADYDKIQERDRISVKGLAQLVPGSPVTVELHHQDCTVETLQAVHTYDAKQIEWFRAGSALNYQAQMHAGHKA